MTQTAKERIEEEIKDVNRSLVYSLNKNGRAFNSGKRQGLTIALAHVENAGKSQHSKLSIPKKIAEQANKIDFDGLFQLGKEEFYQWFDHEHDKYKEVIYAYLAGKGLGVELVEVSDE